MFIPGSSAEPRGFVEELATLSPDLPKLDIVHSFVPGVNTIPLASDENQLIETSVFPQKRSLVDAGRAQIIPASYYGFCLFLSGRIFDWVFVQLSPPDTNGQCSLGPTAEFLPVALKHSKNRVGLINSTVPNIPGAPKISLDELTHILEIDSEIPEYDPGAADEASMAISRYLAEIIQDGDTLQLGLGKVPTQLQSALVNHRNLSMHTGLISGGYLELLDAGALSTDSDHTTCATLGSKAFYQRLPDAPQLKIAGVDYTHKPSTLSGLDSLIAINSAIEVDLFGQANLEYIGNRKISSAGGAADFADAASRNLKCKSIIALPATNGDGTTSRIVGSLGKAPVSLSGLLIDMVVTEYGLADLTHKTAHQRAEALIEAAHPDHRPSLSEHL